MRIRRVVLAASLLLATCWLSGGVCREVSAALAPTPNSVAISGRQLTVDGKPFKIKGIAYSPVPQGESVHQLPHGDYYTSSYMYIWARDLPLMRSMGLNTLRVYAWDSQVNHTLFLDACHQYGMKVILTHYVGTNTENPINTPADQQKLVAGFVDHVKRVGDHPAILMWSFGNELNGPWNDFLAALSTQGRCDWQRFCTNVVDKSNPCFEQSECMYRQFFPWLETALAAAKNHTTRPLTSTFADLDVLIRDDPSIDKIPRFESLVPSMDVWTIQLYRGASFVEFFQQYARETDKPLLVGEYGVDAQNDPCGWPEHRDIMQPCFITSPGVDGQPGGSVDTGDDFVGCDPAAPGSNLGCQQPGEVTQTQWDTKLTQQILESDVTVGGILMSWHDENWKNIGTQDQCKEPCAWEDRDTCADPTTEQYQALNRSYDDGGCTAHAHITCSQHDTMVHDSCGYFLGSAPDAYVNEAWFGLHSTSDCGVSTDAGHRLSALQARPVVGALATIFGGNNTARPLSCSTMRACWECSTTSTEGDITAGTCDSKCGTNFAALVEQDDGGNTPVLPPPGMLPGNEEEDEDVSAAFGQVTPLAIISCVLAMSVAFFAL